MLSKLISTLSSENEKKRNRTLTVASQRPVLADDRIIAISQNVEQILRLEGPLHLRSELVGGAYTSIFIYLHCVICVTKKYAP